MNSGSLGMLALMSLSLAQLSPSLFIIYLVVNIKPPRPSLSLCLPFMLAIIMSPQLVNSFRLSARHTWKRVNKQVGTVFDTRVCQAHFHIVEACHYAWLATPCNTPEKCMYFAWTNCPLIFDLLILTSFMPRKRPLLGWPLHFVPSFGHQAVHHFYGIVSTSLENKSKNIIEGTFNSISV
jgi:hypothetical protein